MSSNPIQRISALASDYIPGRFGKDGKIGVIFQEIPDLTLWQVAAWADNIATVSAITAAAIGIKTVPGPGKAVMRSNRAILRVEPLKFWITGIKIPQLINTEGVLLDLSHSRTHLRVTGPKADILLNRYLPLDLRSQYFFPGSVVSVAFHHIGVTLWRSEAGFELFLPRSFALSLWELLRHSARQFGYQVT